MSDEFDELVEFETNKLSSDMLEILSGKKKDTLRSLVFQIMFRTASWRYHKSLEQLLKYPKNVADHIVQYDEHVFVWIDETDNVGGASSTLEQAQESLEQYAKFSI